MFHLPKTLFLVELEIDGNEKQGEWIRGVVLDHEQIFEIFHGETSSWISTLIFAKCRCNHFSLLFLQIVLISKKIIFENHGQDLEYKNAEHIHAKVLDSKQITLEDYK